MRSLGAKAPYKGRENLIRERFLLVLITAVIASGWVSGFEVNNMTTPSLLLTMVLLGPLRTFLIKANKVLDKGLFKALQGLVRVLTGLVNTYKGLEKHLEDLIEVLRRLLKAFKSPLKSL